MLLRRSAVLLSNAVLVACFSSTTRAFRPAGTKARAYSDSTRRFVDANKAPRHDVGQSAREPLPEALQKQLEAYQTHQQAAPKMDWATDVRTLVQYNHGFAVMSTHSKSDPLYPGGSVVGFAPDRAGKPLFILSGMSTHTQDILANPHCSLTVAAKDFKGAADGRVNLMGRAELIRDSKEKEEARAIYKKKHPGTLYCRCDTGVLWRSHSLTLCL
jgi:hypothetical protein